MHGHIVLNQMYVDVIIMIGIIGITINMIDKVVVIQIFNIQVVIVIVIVIVHVVMEMIMHDSASTEVLDTGDIDADDATTDGIWNGKQVSSGENNSDNSGNSGNSDNGDDTVMILVIIGVCVVVVILPIVVKKMYFVKRKNKYNNEISQENNEQGYKPPQPVLDEWIVDLCN